MTRVVVAGGGPAAIESLLVLREHEGVETTLISADAEFAYRPHAVGEPFGLSRVERFPLERICELCSTELVVDRVVAVNTARQTIDLALDEARAYDAALIAIGARPVEAIGGAITFTGRGGDEEFERLLQRLVDSGGEVVFAVPHRVRWSLPLYELALLTAEHVRAHGSEPVSLRVVTPEPEPLAVFGGAASREITDLLDDADIELLASADPLGHAPYEGSPPVVALPRLIGPALPGLPYDEQGFLHVDDFGRVLGTRGVYAAGDATDFPLKQAGLATEEADVAATAILADTGYPVEARPLHPILRGRLDTLSSRRFLRRDLYDRDESSADVATKPLWWPGAKVAGRYLAPFLAAFASVESRERSAQ